MRFHPYGEEQKPVIIMLGPICEADACVTFDYPAMDREFQKHLTFFYSKEESAWRLCHRKLQRRPIPLQITSWSADMDM